MKKKIKLYIAIFLIIIVTSGCIAGGIHTRHVNAIIVTQMRTKF